MVIKSEHGLQANGVDRATEIFGNSFLMVTLFPQRVKFNFWQWLESFCELHPTTRVVVTSRVLPGTGEEGSGKVNENWNPPNGFSDVTLEEMSDKELRKRDGASSPMWGVGHQQCGYGRQ